MRALSRRQALLIILFALIHRASHIIEVRFSQHPTYDLVTTALLHDEVFVFDDEISATKIAQQLCTSLVTCRHIFKINYSVQNGTLSAGH